MANIIGEYPPIERVETGFFSLDRALSDGESLGVPMTIIEIFGNQDIGKSNIATSLAGIMAEHYSGNLVYLPIEHIDRNLMGRILDSVSFTGDAYILGGWDMVKKFTKHKKDKEHPHVTDEMNFDCLLEAYHDDKNVVGVVDSLTQINPVMFSEGSTSEMHMGRRAMLTSALVRGAGYTRRFRDIPMALIMLSHKQQSLSMYPTNRGTDTTGGDIKRDLAKVRIFLKRPVEKLLEFNKGDNAFVVEGKVEKLSFGREGGIFYLVVLGGKGIHRGLTAVYECKMAQLCTFGANITMGGKKYGSMATILKEAHSGNDEFFLPFINALKNPSSVGKAVPDEEEPYEGEEAT